MDGRAGKHEVAPTHKHGMNHHWRSKAANRTVPSDAADPKGDQSWKHKLPEQAA